MRNQAVAADCRLVADRTGLLWGFLLRLGRAATGLGSGFRNRRQLIVVEVRLNQDALEQQRADESGEQTMMLAGATTTQPARSPTYRSRGAAQPPRLEHFKQDRGKSHATP